MRPPPLLALRLRWQNCLATLNKSDFGSESSVLHHLTPITNEYITLLNRTLLSKPNDTQILAEIKLVFYTQCIIETLCLQHLTEPYGMHPEILKAQSPETLTFLSDIEKTINSDSLPSWSLWLHKHHWLRTPLQFLKLDPSSLSIRMAARRGKMIFERHMIVSDLLLNQIATCASNED